MSGLLDNIWLRMDNGELPIRVLDHVSVIGWVNGTS